MYFVLVACVLILPGSFCEHIFFFNSGDDLGVKYETDSAKRNIQCYVQARSTGLEESENTQQVSKRELRDIIDECTEGGSERGRDRRAAINIVAPGTKWCGTGEIASNYNDLGSQQETDKCCRAHDHCKPSIDGFSNKGIFINTLPWTRLHCDCDKVFHDCLKSARNTNNAEKTVADLVGYTYFHVTNAKCFKEHSYKICTKIGWFKCDRYTYINTYKWHGNKNY